jgi:uncharacterized glyoxalase superfamily protein PhnB
MAGPVKPVREGFHTITPHLIVKGAAAAIDFYKKAFGAKEHSRSPGPGGKLMHADIQIGDSRIMMADEFPEFGAIAPSGPSPVTIHVYVPDVDATFKQAVDAGATVAMPVGDMPWGDRYGKLVDPFGHSWSVATHKEDVSIEEVERRMAAGMAGSKPRSE